MSEQLVFDLPSRVALGRDAFLLTDSNAQAVALIDGFRDWQSPVQWLYGPSGCGKSHLAAVLAAQVAALIITAEGVAAEPQIASLLAGEERPDILILDGLDAMAQEDEEVLFHLMNQARNGGVPLLLLSQKPAAQLAVALPDLMSRLKAVAAIELGHADDALVAGLLRKLFADRQVSVEARVIDFLVPRIDRDYAAMGRLVEAIDKAALAQQRGVTVPLVRALLPQDGPGADEDYS